MERSIQELLAQIDRDLANFEEPLRDDDVEVLALPARRPRATPPPTPIVGRSSTDSEPQLGLLSGLRAPAEVESARARAERAETDRAEFEARIGAIPVDLAMFATPGKTLRRRRRLPTWLVAGAALLGVAGLASAATYVVLERIARPVPAATAAAPAAAPVEAPAAAPVEAPAAATVEAVEPAALSVLVIPRATTITEVDAPSPTAASREPAAVPASRAPSPTAAAASRAPTPTAAAAADPAADPAAGDDDDLDDAPALPPRLDRSALLRGLASATSQLRRCAAGHPPATTLTFVVGPFGNLQSVTSSPTDIDLEGCAASALGATIFPQSGAGGRIRLPLSSI